MTNVYCVNVYGLTGDPAEVGWEPIKTSVHDLSYDDARLTCFVLNSSRVSAKVAGLPEYFFAVGMQDVSTAEPSRPWWRRLVAAALV